MRKYLWLLFFLAALPLSAQQRIWEGTACKASGVTLTEFLPAGRPEAAVIICPGGSYHWLDREAEGVRVAEWLRDNGMAAYVLEYRVAGKAEFVLKYRLFLRGNRHPDPLCDVQRAIQLVRERFDGPVGVMGFSAGGHLAMSAAEFSGTCFPSRYGIVPEVSLRPDFVVPVYPVVTLSDPRYVHKRSRLGLLGETRACNRVLRDSLSLEKHVTEGLPPVFLVNCIDDPVVDYHNSVLLDSALTAHAVPHTYLQLQTGGHGFGADPRRLGAETSAWMGAFLNWFRHDRH